MIVKMIQYSSAIKRRFRDAHQPPQTIIIKCWVSQLVQKRCDQGKHTKYFVDILNWNNQKYSSPMKLCVGNCSSESTDPDRSKNRKNGEKQSTTMSGSAMAWELFLWFSFKIRKIQMSGSKYHTNRHHRTVVLMQFY